MKLTASGKLSIIGTSYSPSFSPLHLRWKALQRTDSDSEERRSVARLCLFYKIVKSLVAVPLPYYI